MPSVEASIAADVHEIAFLYPRGAKSQLIRPQLIPMGANAFCEKDSLRYDHPTRCQCSRSGHLNERSSIIILLGKSRQQNSASPPDFGIRLSESAVRNCGPRNAQSEIPNGKSHLKTTAPRPNARRRRLRRTFGPSRLSRRTSRRRSPLRERAFRQRRPFLRRL